MTIGEAEALQIHFGHYGHRGLTLGEIAAEDPLYLDWLAGRTNLGVHLKEAISLLCTKHERRIDQAMARHEKPKLFDAPPPDVPRHTTRQTRLF